jgi:hypothetical protein
LLRRRPYLDPLKDAPARAAITSACASLRQRPTTVGPLPLITAPAAFTLGLAHPPNGQTIWVTEGVGLVQRGGGPIEVIRPGDRVFFEPGEDYWHGSAPSCFMTHLAMLDVNDKGNSATWRAHVTDEEYGAEPPIDK